MTCAVTLGSNSMDRSGDEAFRAENVLTVSTCGLV